MDNEQPQSGGAFLATAAPQGEIQQSNSSALVAASAAKAQIEASLVIAKKFPRDVNAAFTKIMKACQRPTLAEAATYLFKRGGAPITGPSIRLAEVMAQNYGNMQYGVEELERTGDTSHMVAFAWDCENNVRVEQKFNVKHWRDTQSGGYQLEQERDIYEVTANMGSRRVRACILRVIPGDFVDAALERCTKTLNEGDKRPLEDRIRAMIVAFEEVGVSKDMIEVRIGHSVDSIIVQEVVQLSAIFKSIRDGFGKREDWFELGVKGDQPTEEEDQIPMGSSSSSAAPAKKKTTKKKTTTKKAAPKKEAAPADPPKMEEPQQPATSSASAADDMFDGDEGEGVDRRESLVAEIKGLAKEDDISLRNLIDELHARKLLHPKGNLGALTIPQAGQVIANWAAIVDSIENPTIDG